MHDRLLRPSRVLGTGAIAALGVAMAVACTTADAQVPVQSATPTVTVIGDSVVVSGQPFGQASVQVTRPDASTGKPVVLGQFAGRAGPLNPFTVNTTTPTPLNQNGDCWQPGALSRALTPDILGGDTVNVVGAPGLFGAPPKVTSVAVPAGGPGGTAGPIPDCRSIAPLAHNAVTSAPKNVASDPIAVSGVAQPLATGVSVSVSDGTDSTTPVAVAPAADGTWSATIPAAQVAALANGPLSLRAVFTVPDVSTGASAHIGIGTVSIQKLSAGAMAKAQAQAKAKAKAKAKAALRVGSLRVEAQISVKAAASGDLRASFVVPKGARVIALRLLHARHTVLNRVVHAAKAGTRQSVRLRSSALRHRGTYTLTVRAGASRASLGATAHKTIHVR